jgi:hypothetical protein
LWLSQHIPQLPLVAITEKGERIVGVAQGELVDVVGLMARLQRPQMLKALETGIDDEADDAHALSAQDRAARLNELARNRLMIERQEAALVWAAQAQGDSVEHRADADVRTVLSIELRTMAA